jgi:superfamily II DNA or RNA helicase
MADLRKAERRKRELKLRRAEEQREWDREYAVDLARDAYFAYRKGDLVEAMRETRRALSLCPDHAPAVSLLGQIHLEAGHFADALPHLLHLRKLDPGPGVTYNIARALHGLGRMEEALAEYQALLKIPRRDAMMVKARELAKQFSLELERAIALRDAARTAPVRPVPAAPPQPAPEPAKKAAPARAPLPRVQVDFLPAPALDFQAPQAGTLPDYFLRRALVELRQAQSFEDLISLPSLNGVDTYAHQHETVRRVLRQFKGRALLADETGLGKTIEACLVLKEYWARGMVRRALVLTPPSLVAQWKGELTEKFGFNPVSPDGAEFRADPEAFWRNQELIVASIAMARLEPNAGRLAGAPWDMVIVDEAHCLKNRTSANWKLVNSLEKRFILMLTATPVENHLVELYNLITVLKPGLLSTEVEFKKRFVTPGKPKTPSHPGKLRELLGEVMVRNTRSVADVKLPHRIASTVTVEPSPAEAEIYGRVSRFVAGRYGASARHATGLEWLLRQAGSSPQALGRSIGRALQGESWVAREDWPELEAIREIAGGIPQSGKGEQLARMLAAHGGKAVVFTEFLPTLEYLAGICRSHGISFAAFTGELSRAEKDAAIARFRDEAQVLLATGSGGEGHNLQFASTVINFDLPWNPMRLEQRVGRVHRIGQVSDVFVFNFCQAGTIEEQLLRVLHDKINMFELVVGEMDALLGGMDDDRDFSQLVLDLWLSGDDAEIRAKAFDDLAARLLTSKKHYVETKKLDDALFERDFEV